MEGRQARIADDKPKDDPGNEQNLTYILL